jgi:hypothetical protein
MKLPGMIYDRMVQNAREARDGEERDCDRPGQRERRLRQRQKEELAVAQLSPKHQDMVMQSAKRDHEKTAAQSDERLFGDPPEHGSLAQQWSDNPGGVVLAVLFLCASIAASVALLAYGGPSDGRAARAPIEVEK